MAERASQLRRVRVLINPRSGVFSSWGDVLRALEEFWDHPGIDLSYQFSRSAEDGRAKTRRAIEDGVDTVLVIGGDGMVNSIGSELIGTDVALGVIPTGSGNGFARHFNIPLIPEKAAQALANAERRRIDVGTAGGQPFFVTCSMAWDAAMVRSFEKSPVRGILPYVLAGAYELITYTPQTFEVRLDGGRREVFKSPLVFTVANLTQFGGGARIAPDAEPDDGTLELVVVCRKDAVSLIGDFVKLFDGTINEVDKVTTLRFAQLDVKRERAAPMQVDGELIDAPADVSVRVLPKALSVLVPLKSDV